MNHCKQILIIIHCNTSNPVVRGMQLIDIRNAPIGRPYSSFAVSVLWIDEAGLLGIKDMTALLELATRCNARLILSGDTRQHSSVVRGDALRILNTVAGIKSVDVSHIYRQKNNAYREVVESLAQGDIHTAFQKLKMMGAIKKTDPLNSYESVAQDYSEILNKGKTALIVSPTHNEAAKVTAAIRDKLRSEGKIKGPERTITKLVNLNLTEAQKTDMSCYKTDYQIRFNRKRDNVPRGSLWSININGKDAFIQNEKHVLPFAFEQAQDFEVYHKQDIAICKRDKIRITRNGMDKKNKRLNNGQMLEVIDADHFGVIRVRNAISKVEYHLPAEFGHLDHGYCITSHASQGKTVDEVLIMQPSATFPATDMKQFYVSVSRGRDAVHIYTDDEEALLEYASENGNRLSAIELTRIPNMANTNRIGKSTTISNKPNSHLTLTPPVEKVRTHEFKPVM